MQASLHLLGEIHSSSELRIVPDVETEKCEKERKYLYNEESHILYTSHIIWKSKQCGLDRWESNACRRTARKIRNLKERDHFRDESLEIGITLKMILMDL
jgi:hypothetical protein